MTIFALLFFAVAIFFALLGLVLAKPVRDRRRQILKRLYGGERRDGANASAYRCA